MTVAFDPFEAGFAQWPYDQYRRLREEEPVHWSDLLTGWVLTRYDDVAGVLRDATVSSELERATPSPALDLTRMRQQVRDLAQTTLVLLDDPAHARLRKLMQAPFTARAKAKTSAHSSSGSIGTTTWSPLPPVVLTKVFSPTSCSSSRSVLAARTTSCHSFEGDGSRSNTHMSG